MLAYFHKALLTMMFSSNASHFVLALAAASNAVTSATGENQQANLGTAEST
jgi:hypothetical protein